MAVHKWEIVTAGLGVFADSFVQRKTTQNRKKTDPEP